MRARTNTPPARRALSCGGFTLVELIAVLVIVAILAAMTVPAMSNVTSNRRVIAARMLLHGLTFARQHAVATGLRTWVVFDDEAAAWRLLVENPLVPGRADAIPLTDAATGRDMVEQLAVGRFKDVEITSVNLDGGTEIGFDWLGRPLSADEADLAATGAIVLSGGHRLTIEVETGQVRYRGP